MAIVSLLLQKNSEHWMTRSMEVKERTIDVYDLLQGSESELRGYLLTNDSIYLQPFDDVEKKVEQNLNNLLELTMKDPEQHALLIRFSVYARAKLDIIQKTYVVFNSGQLEKALEIVNTDAGESLMNKLTEFKFKILAKEDRLLMERKHDNVLLQRLSFILMFLGILLAGYSLYKLYKRIGPLINELNLANANLWNSIQEKNKEIELRKQAELKNDEYISLLTSKNAELNHFAYIASHDLQEPLRTVNNFIEVFKEDYGEKLGEDAHQYFDFIFGATHRMKALIEGLLNYSRLGKSKWAEKVDLNEVIAITRANLAATIASKKAMVNEDGQMPCIVCMKTETTQLFQNLINNAIKYTAPDVVPKITITADDKDSHWEFCVADNGIGIPEVHQSKIFNMFSRLHGDGDYQGQGIGLAFCKKIVELHDGNIWVNSEPGKGSLFYFTISKKLKDETETQ